MRFPKLSTFIIIFLAFTGSASVAEIINVPPVEIIQMDHTFDYINEADMGVVRDAVTFPSGPGSFSGPGFTASIGDGDTIVVRLEAPSNEKFVVTKHPDPEVGTTFFFNAFWYTGQGDFLSSYYSSGTITFESIIGTTPTEFLGLFLVCDDGQTIATEAYFHVFGDFEFTAVEARFTVAQPLADQLRTYGAVTSGSEPSFGVIATNGTNGGPVSDQTVMAIMAVPEPCSLVLLSLGGLALRLFRPCSRQVRSGQALLRKRRA